MDLPGHFHDFDYIFPASDISRVDAQRVDPRFHGGERQAVVKMDVRHQRRVRHLLQVFQRFRRFPVRHSHPDDIRARFFQRIDLRCRVCRIHGAECAHGLNGDRCSASDPHAPYIDLSGFSHHCLR